ncbi:uncharacterized protein [Fopius arisanus]|uniref:Reverse transcriptase domain-containing protein n=1 Tax=Fopius arisanus TaxID=64838 RepID=A0A9R1TQU1_9HYME|nr:PREDICTED: uncharacterized protein LOC105272667 [Fopius arisanus]
MPKYLSRYSSIKDETLRSSPRISSTSSSRRGNSRGIVKVTLQSNCETAEQLIVNAYTLKRLTTKIPSYTCKPPKLKQLNELELADATFCESGNVDLVIGSDYYGKLIKVKKTANQELLELIKKFRVQEEVSCKSTESITPEEQECEDHFIKNTSRDEDGRYIRTESKLEKKMNFGNLYKDFINEYENLNHTRRVPSTPEPVLSFYFPHHGILREASLTTKLRVVFNGSSRTSTGISLNDILNAGPKLQIDNLDVLTWFRKHRLVFGADIIKMFRQIKVHEDDWDYQRILWYNEANNLVEFQMTTVTYGGTSAPWLSLRVCEELVKDEGHKYPKAVAAMTRGKFVDDIYDGADTVQELEEKVTELKNLCMAGGFPLSKWCSNSPQLLEKLKVSAQHESSTQLFEDTESKVLGIKWDQQKDTLQITVKAASRRAITKRIILSQIAQIYDPIGIVAPVIARAKIIMQQVWKRNVNWDDRLPEDITLIWKTFREELEHLSKINKSRSTTVVIFSRVLAYNINRKNITRGQHRGQTNNSYSLSKTVSNRSQRAITEVFQAVRAT